MQVRTLKELLSSLSLQCCVICFRTWSIGGRLFASKRLKLLHCDWHPSRSRSLLVLLTSDNTIRIYTTDEPDFHIQTYCLDTSGDASPSKLRFQHALGEAAVGFDFAPYVSVTQTCDVQLVFNN